MKESLLYFRQTALLLGELLYYLAGAAESRYEAVCLMTITARIRVAKILRVLRAAEVFSGKLQL